VTLPVITDTSARVTLLAPGCFSTVAQQEEGESRNNVSQAPIDQNDAVAVQTSSQCYEQALAVALQQPAASLGELPIAQYQYSFETGASAPAHCVCAELVHLQADKDNARLLPFAALSVSHNESSALIESVNQLINPDQLRVEETRNGHLYLCGMPATSLDTWPAHAVANGKIANYLPRDSQAGDWRRLMTEVQMLFHDHPVNNDRVAAGLLPINAMWFWGGAKSNAVPADLDVVLIAEDAYASGLANQLDITLVPSKEFKWDACKGHVIILDTAVYEAWLSGDQKKLNHQKLNLQTQWIQPAQQAVANGQLSDFTLDGCEGQSIVETPKLSTASFARSFRIKDWLNARISTKFKKSTPKVKK